MGILRFGPRHGNFYIAAGCGILALLVGFLFSAAAGPALAATLFSLVYLGLTAKDLPTLTPDYLRQHAEDEDAPPWIVFVLTICEVVYVTVALFMAINAGKSPDPSRLALGIVSVVLSWLMIHVLWAMHYGWEYYEAPDDAARRKNKKQKGGLDFPGEEEPDGTAFIYFSFVVAMTAQTSDTDVTNNLMRRIVTAHSLFSYLFNTVVIAAAVNIVVQLGSGGG